LLQLTKTYLSIEATLKSTLLSDNTRRLLELAIVELDRDIARGMKLKTPRNDRRAEHRGPSTGSTA
jgi:hypothetical protein